MEEWVEKLFFTIGIVKPEDMDIHFIADRLNIEIVYSKCRPFSDVNKKVIFLNKRDKEPISRFMFYHELCHMLRHAGDQRLLSELFIEGQEIEANHFAMYASMPFYMISELEMPERTDLAVQYLTEVFNVPRSLAKKRLEQILRRIAQGMLDEQSIKVNFDVANNYKEESIKESYVIYSYHDYTDDVSGPSQLIVHVSDSILSSTSDFSIDVSGSFERLDIEEAIKFNYTSLKPNDLYCRNGHIYINFDILRLKYGKLHNRLVIQMKDIEEIVKYEYEIANF
ncbi:hypothetical protein D3C74_228380 [compost metagenome]